MDSQEAQYQLSKCIPNMRSGFSIQTDYGAVHVKSDDPECAKIIALLESLLKKRSVSHD